MQATNNPTIDKFILDVLLIEPIQYVIDGLNNGEFRDCDIKWLDNKYQNYVKIASETLGIAFPTQIEEDYKFKRTVLNDYVTKYYIDRFTILLNYFKSF